MNKQSKQLIVFMVFSFLLILSSSHANHNYNDQILLIKQPKFDLSIDHQYYFFKDTSNKLTIAELTSPQYTYRFTLAHDRKQVFGFTDATLWLRINIANLQKTSQSSFLSVAGISLSDVNLYRPELNSHAKSILPVPQFKTISSIDHNFQLELQPEHSETVYLSISSPEYVDFSLSLSSPNNFSRAINFKVLLNYSALGILFYLLCSQLFFAIFYSSRSHCYFALLLSSVIIFHALQSNVFNFLPLITTTSLHRLTAVVILLICICNLLFSHEFFKQLNRPPNLFRVIHGLIYIYTTLLISMSAPFLTSITLMSISVNAFLVTTFFLSLSCWFKVRSDERLLSFKLFACAQICLFSFGCMAVQSYIPFSPFHWIHDYWFTPTFAIVALLMANALQKQQKLKQQRKLLLQQQTTIAQAETEAKTNFLLQISHDLRTPMNGILGMTELLQETTLSAQQREFSNTIHSAGKNLLKTLNDLLDYAKIESGKLELTQKPLELSSLIKECLDPFQMEAETKNIELITHMTSNVPDYVIGDPARLRQILLYLFSHTLRFAEHGEIFLKVSLTNEQLIKGLYKIFCFELRYNTGSNHPEPVVPFYNDSLTKSNNQSKYEHTNIGLMVAKNLIHLMQGSINEEYQPNQESRIWFNIPLQPQPDPVIKQQQPQFNLLGLKLLIVDDNASCRTVLEQQATHWGMQVVTAVNGKHAIAILRTQATLKNPFDAVILDYDMPGMNGLELAAKVQKDGLITNDILLIMLTGIGVTPSSDTIQQVGIQRVLTKPVSGKALKITLSEELQRLQEKHYEVKFKPQKDSVAAPIKVLLVTKHTLNQNTLNDPLSQLPIAVDAVTNKGMVMANLESFNYDLIFIDFAQCSSKYESLAQDIRHWEHSHQKTATPIIALINQSDQASIEKKINDKINSYLLKPIQLTELNIIITEWVLKDKKNNPTSLSLNKPMGQVRIQ